MGLRYVFYGDDFTGATDTLATVAQAGLSALLFLGVPNARHLAAAKALDVLGVAGTARAMAPEPMRAELARVAQYFASLSVPLVHYKCCSTFDSSAYVGNLAVALRTMTDELRPEVVSIVGGQPSLGRYCFMGHLFAAAGDGEVYRIDRHPTMSRHPVTPMHESDLRRHLAEQGLESIGLVDTRILNSSPEAIEARLRQLRQGGDRVVLFDVVDAEHLEHVGRIVLRDMDRGTVLALGASSVAQAVIGAWRSASQLAPIMQSPALKPATTPVFVLAGSQSPVTARQVEFAKPHYEIFPLAAACLVSDPAKAEAYAMACAEALRSGQSVLAHTDRASESGADPGEVSAACGRLLARVLELAPTVRRIGVAGGDTSSLSISALETWGLSFISSIGSGVSLVRTHSDRSDLDGLELMLKGGQMGPPEVFELLLHG